MTTLYQFNSAAVDVLSGTGFKDRLDDLIENIDAEVRGALAERAPNEIYGISWDENGMVISLSESQMEREYGIPGTPLNPAVRTALMSAAQALRSELAIRE